MKRITTTLLAAFLSATVFSQNITGQWNGVLKVQGIQLRLVFHVSKTDSGFVSTMDSPDQGAKDIPVTSTSFKDSTVIFTVASATIEYKGILGKDSIIVGDFKQAGRTIPLNLSRSIAEKAEIKRPQEPKKPYPYYAEDVKFENKTAGITLAGTLTLPKSDGVYPAVVLITGSGPQNRDEELLGHKPFLILSDYLTRNGIAVLRVDDRGTAQSTGNFKTATTADFATDVEAAVQYLLSRKEINKKKIGLIGHSEGGIIAPMVAERSSDVSFIILLAGTGIRGDKLLLLQDELIEKADGASDSALAKNKSVSKGALDIVIKSTSTEQLKNDLTTYFKQYLKDNPNDKPANTSDDDFITQQVNGLSSPWMQYFIKYDPAGALEHVKCPVLAINGSKDLQVPPKENLPAIKAALAKGGNKDVTTKELPGLNHLFQECKTGSPSEYASIEQTFSPTALSVILEWIQKEVK